MPGIMYIGVIDGGFRYLFFDSGAVRRAVSSAEVTYLRDQKLIPEITLSGDTAAERTSTASVALFGI